MRKVAISFVTVQVSLSVDKGNKFVQIERRFAEVERGRRRDVRVSEGTREPTLRKQWTSATCFRTEMIGK